VFALTFCRAMAWCAKSGKIVTAPGLPFFRRHP
jgi:hypothetical protein